MLHLVGCLYYLYQWHTVKKLSDNEIYLLIKYIKSVLWRVLKRLSLYRGSAVPKGYYKGFVFRRCKSGCCNRWVEYFYCFTGYCQCCLCVTNWHAGLYSSDFAIKCGFVCGFRKRILRAIVFRLGMSLSNRNYWLSNINFSADLHTYLALL